MNSIKHLRKLLMTIFTLIMLLTPFSYLKNNITFAEDKVYTVPIELWHAENSGKLSMGSKALSPSAKIKENSNGTIDVTITFVAMDFMNKHGHLLDLKVYPTALFSGEAKQATVISTYEDTDLNGNKTTFPKELTFNYATTKPDKIGVQVSVDAMNQIMGGDAAQNAIIKFNWDGSKEETISKETTTSDNTSVENFTKTNLEDYFKSDEKTKNSGLYTTDVTAAYLNPLTGITADGGTKNVAIGEGMSQGVISPINSADNINEALNNQKTSGEKRWSKALLQRTKDGKLYATIRIHLMNWVTRSNEQGPFIKVLQKDGDFKLVEASETKVNIEQYKDSYVDYRFEVPNENFLAMVQMYVEPMNRPVRFFVQTNNTISEGNNTDMAVIEEKNYNKYITVAGGLIFLAAIVTFVRTRNKNKGQ